MEIQCQFKINNQIFIVMIKLKNLVTEQKTQVKRILLDMDGVLCDFEKQRAELAAKHKEPKPNWKFLTKTGGVDFWATMDWMDGGQELVRFVESLPTPKAILTAGFGYEPKVGKKKWLKANGMGKYAEEGLFNIVGSGKQKGKLIRPGDLLIDDKQENIDIVRMNGGIGILHKNTASTIEQLKKYYE